MKVINLEIIKSIAYARNEHYVERILIRNAISISSKISA